MRPLFVLLLVISLFAFVGCVTPTPSPTPPATGCGSAGCTGSQICAMGGPAVVYDVTEIGLAGVMVADPSTKAPINKAFVSLQADFQQPGLTWGQVTAAMASQVAAATNTKWAPLIQAVINTLGSIPGTAAVDPCDQGFLLQDCANVIAETQGQSRLYRWASAAPNSVTAASPSFSFGAGSLGIKVGQ